MTGLPDGWVMATLNEVLEPQARGRLLEQGWSPQCLKEASEDSTVWGVLKTTAIQPGSFLAEHNKRLPDHLDPRPGIEVQVGDLLLTCAGPRSRCGIPTLVRNTRPRLMISGKMYRFRAKASVMEPTFLEKYLLSPLAQRAIDDMKTGVSDSGLNLTHERFLRLEVPVPPLDEQRRIVAILEDHLSRLDAASAGLQRAAQQALMLRRSAIEHCRDEASEYPQTTIMTVADLGRVTSGATPLKSNRAYYEGGAIPWVTSADLSGGDVTRPKQFITERALTETSVKLIPAGSLLVAMYGEGKTRGTVAELQFEATTNQACAAIIFNAEHEGLREWVKLLLEANYFGLRRMASGGVQPNLSVGLIKALPLPIPPMAVVRDLVNRARSASEGAFRARGAVLEAEARGKALRRALLASAFTGSLAKESSLV